MNLQLVRKSILASLAFATVAFSQTPVALDHYYQVRYIANLNVADSFINVTNTGAQGAGLAAGTAASTIGSLCVNVYAFSPDEQMISCCSCPVTPNGLVSISARNSLISNTLTPAVPTSIVVKLVATLPTPANAANSTCATSAQTVNTGAAAPGMLAWGTSIKAGVAGGAAAVVETEFAPATLSPGERIRLNDLCNFIVANGSGFGICRSCQLGGLGAGRR